ncbi:glycerophosphoryl diester phosphodiesterase membrane domain-containing protein [Staphylococcus delphini]|uniref:glycerophosphoryl diester phosphodiesterase membrane domain-containing protein n=1 Tax=Staphylococcus delphini TaxID=53344 RepID=UPI000BBC2AA8|nr:glycerophosphodiester phosphodiesterase [Staphylococcus delphini]PCF41202.1 hypothetical protein B5C06_08850 [Staphylococcus delphini]
MQLKTYLRAISKNLYQHQWRYLINVTLLQIVLVTMSALVLSTLFQWMLHNANETQLNKENYLHILLNPINIILLCVFIYVLALLMLIEFSFLTLLTYGDYKEEHYTIRTILLSAFNTFRQLFGIQLLYFIFYFILTLPLANLTMSSILTQDLYIPKFITGEIVKTPMGLTLYSLGIIIFAWLNYRLILVIPLMILCGYNVSHSMKHSWQLTRRHPFKLISVILILYTALLLSIIVLIVISVSVFSIIDSQGQNWATASLLFILLKGIFFFGTVMTKLILVATLVYYLMDQQPIQKKLTVIPSRPYSWIVKLVLIAILIGVSISSVYDLHEHPFNNKVDIIAHRGFVKKGVENSRESLKAAGDLKVDYVELDVVMTQDQQFVVIHDNELKRLTGQEGTVQDMTLSELQKLTLHQGDWTSKIMTLDEAVQQAKRQQTQLLIELKPYGKEPANYIDLLLKKVNQLHIGQHGKLMSLDYELISQIKKRTDAIECGYVIPFQIGDLPQTNLDFYLIEDFSYTPNLVTQAHHMHKQLYVWTINGENDIVKYLNTPVDGIITDDPDVVHQQKQTFLFENAYVQYAIRAFLY